jgi:hypothetical protein
MNRLAIPSIAVRRNRYQKIKHLLKTTEPELSLLSEKTITRIHLRNNPIPGMTSAYWLDAMTAMDVKKLLLYLDPDLIPLITSLSFKEIMELQAPFPDPHKDYPGVYMGGFMIDGRELNKGEILRIANILVKQKATSQVLDLRGQFASWNTLRSSRALGDVWKRTLQDEGLWRDVAEIEINMGGERYAESEESEDEDIEEITPVADFEGKIVPDGLDEGKYLEFPPYSSVYVGYSVTPKQRFKAHTKRTSLFEFLTKLQMRRLRESTQ